MKRDTINKIISVLAITAGLFHLYTSIVGVVTTQKMITLGLIGTIGFLYKPINGKFNEKEYIHLIDIFFALIMLLIGFYMHLNYASLVNTIGESLPIHIILGFSLMILVLELTRRTIGWPLVIITIIFILYGLLGEFLPGTLKMKSFSIYRISSYLILSDGGIYGPSMAAISRFVILFILLGSFLKSSGVGDYFINVTRLIFSGMRGGPAKIAVVASAFYGTISGSSTANVATTGTFTIPLMKKSGFSSVFAGAVEAAASTGGQFTPPIMGTTAFVMAGIIGIPYTTLMRAAIIPALLYYLCVFCIVDLRAFKLGLKGKKEVIDWSYTISGVYKIFPIFLLVYLLVGLHLSLMRSALYTIIVIIIFSWFEKCNRMNLKKILGAIDEGIRSSISIVAASSCAGIVIGMVGMTGLGIRISNILLEVSGGNFVITLILAMISCIILGMGVPTLASYIIMSMIIAPTIVGFGVDKLFAHMFVFYFACFSAMTPPVCTASYTAAAISGGDVWKTGINAVQLAIVGFAMPYYIIYNSDITTITGTPLSILKSIIMAIIVIIIVASVIEKNFYGRKMNLITKILSILAIFTILTISK